MLFIKKTISFRILVVLLFLISAHSLFATWSIVAVDPNTGEVGSAGASFTPAVWPILGITGGKGVVVAQAASNENGRVKALKMMNFNKSPNEIFEIITSPDFDRFYEYQQYGIATLNHGSGAYTGSKCADWAGHDADEYVSVQANIMASDHVVSDALDAYHSAERQGLPLADRLIAALVAGSNAGGDSRAGDDTAMTAYVAVAKPGDASGKPSFAIIIPPQGKGVNPVDVLEERYAELKGSEHPVYFPSLLMLVIFLILLPLIIGVVVTVILSFKGKKQKFGLMTLKHLGISELSAVMIFFVMAGICLLFSFAAPIYGTYTWMVPAMIATVNLLFFIIVRAVFMVVRKIRKR